MLTTSSRKTAQVPGSSVSAQGPHESQCHSAVVAITLLLNCAATSADAPHAVMIAPNTIGPGSGAANATSVPEAASDIAEPNEPDMCDALLLRPWFVTSDPDRTNRDSVGLVKPMPIEAMAHPASPTYTGSVVQFGMPRRSRSVPLGSKPRAIGAAFTTPSCPYSVDLLGDARQHGADGAVFEGSKRDEGDRTDRERTVAGMEQSRLAKL